MSATTRLPFYSQGNSLVSEETKLKETGGMQRQVRDDNESVEEGLVEDYNLLMSGFRKV